MILLCVHINAYNRIKNERKSSIISWILDDIGNACQVVASALGDPTSSTPQTNLHSNPCLALNSKDFSVEVLHLFRNQKHQAVCGRCGGGDAKSPPLQHSESVGSNRVARNQYDQTVCCSIAAVLTQGFGSHLH